MARPRFDNADPAKKDAILQTAAREFAQVGYEGASLNRILLAAGVSKGSFYYYFDDKADLACTVLVWAFRDILRAYDGIKIPDDPAKFWDAIHQFSRESLAMLDRIPYANDLLSRLSHAFVNDKTLEVRGLQVLANIGGIWMALITRGQELGVVRSDVSARTLIGIFQGIKEALLREYTANDHVLSKEELEQLANIQLDLFRRVCAPGAGTRS
jgi:AcrR family transcriptional regulator